MNQSVQAPNVQTLHMNESTVTDFSVVEEEQFCNHMLHISLLVGQPQVNLFLFVHHDILLHLYS